MDILELAKKNRNTITLEELRKHYLEEELDSVYELLEQRRIN